MQIPILNGVYADGSPRLRISYPHNMVPVAQQQGVSAGYIRPADGLVEISAGVGPDRGGINWLGVCYRVQGSRLVSIASDGAVSIIGNISGTGPVTFDYSFDYLAIAGGGNLYLYDGAVLAQNVDPDLGTVIDLIWVDGYFLTTDGESLVVTELNDPFAVNPLKYGSSEVDPDKINSVLELGNEVYAVNDTSIEVFNNVGSSGFPFQRINGAQIQKGSVGTHAAVVYDKKIAFVGGERNEPPSVYVAISGQDQRIATKEIDAVLSGYSSAELAETVLEVRKDKGHNWLYIHLPKQTLVYDAATSAVMQQPVWFTLSGGVTEHTRYPARSFVYCYDKWIAGDPTTGKVSEISEDVSSHFGDVVGWQVGTGFIYNESRGAIIHMLELECLTGACAFGDSPIVTTEYSLDGETWSQPMATPAGEYGDRSARVAWLQQGALSETRVQKFYGTSDAHITILRLEAAIEGLAV